MSEVTRILNQISHGSEKNAVELLMPVVYQELRSMAASKIADERPGNTLDATGLVHEAYLRLGEQSFESRRHFFGAAAEAMRRILIDQARARKSDKRGGEFNRADCEPNDLAALDERPADRLQSLSDSLERFALAEPEKAELVKLRYFVGLKIDEAAEILGISTATANRHWAYAKAWLQSDLAN